MCTKQSYDYLLQKLYNEGRKVVIQSPEWRLVCRKTELSELLNGLGLFPYFDDDADSEAVNYRNHTYVYDMVEACQMSFYTVIASLNDRHLETIGALSEVFNEMNASEFLMSIYEVDGDIVLTSSQYLGERELLPDEVTFMLKSMDDVIRRFHRKVKCNECLKSYVTCM